MHLRPDFEPWIAVDLMDKDDREAVFRKVSKRHVIQTCDGLVAFILQAGTRTLPIVFIDDVYVGDYDKLNQLNEEDKLGEPLLFLIVFTMTIVFCAFH